MYIHDYLATNCSLSIVTPTVHQLMKFTPCIRDYMYCVHLAKIKSNHLQCPVPEINMMPSECLDLNFDDLCHWHAPVLSDFPKLANVSNRLSGHDA